jgi:hypothetical protein
MIDRAARFTPLFLRYRATGMKFGSLAFVLIALGFAPSLGDPAMANSMAGRHVVGAAAVTASGSARSAVSGRLQPSGRSAVPTRLNSSLSGSRIRLKH